MNIDLTIAIAVAALVTAIYRLGTTMYSSLLIRKKELREQYKFAVEFLSKVKKGALSPYELEIGYQALVGTTAATQQEVELILSLPNPTHKLRDYNKSMTQLIFINKNDRLTPVYREKYKSKTKRKKLEFLYCTLYFFSSMLATLYLFIPQWLEKIGRVESLYNLAHTVNSNMPPALIAIPFFISLAYLALKLHGEFCAADRLIKSVTNQTQEKTSR